MGTPGIPAMMNQLKLEGAERVLLVPMYPQYSSSTTATAFDDAFSALRRVRNQPELRTIRQYADHPAYIGALAEQVRDYWRHHGQPDFAAGDRLVLSFHGVPKRTMDLGDPYHDQCQQTGSLLMAALGLSPVECRVTFQSRFGRAEWLQPYTAPSLAELGAAGVKRQMCSARVLRRGLPGNHRGEIGIEVRDEFSARGRQGVSPGFPPERIAGLDQGAGRNCRATPARMAGAGAANAERSRIDHLTDHL